MRTIWPWRRVSAPNSGPPIDVWSGPVLLVQINPYDPAVGTLAGLDPSHSPDSPTLAPGGQTIITIGFTQEAGDTPGSFCTDIIQILSDDGDTPSFQITLRGNYN